MTDFPGTRLGVIDDLDRMVHEPARLLLLSCLYVVDAADFVFLMRETGLTQGNLSSHLSKLEAAGYVAVEKSFVRKRPRTLVCLTAGGRAAFAKYVAAMQRLLDGAAQFEGKLETGKVNA
ncbi:MAG: transcriptional regulator [Gemmatimonadales bacterium]|nr:transcriptional regulator [Gemmatimonadales bacterium]MDZ4389733.1 transcriptional regulator [Gemmatimonadales bacterium]